MHGPLLWLSIAVAFGLGLLGLRLVRLAGRTGELPELLLGLFFVSVGPLGFLPNFLVDLWPGARPDYVLLARAVGATGRVLAIALLCLFTWRVFRGRSRWAPWLTGVVLVALMAGFAHSALVERFESGGARDAWWHLRMATRAVVVLWCTAEPLHFHVLARRRVALGLMEPLVANRFLLWSVWGGACLTVQLLAYASAYLDLAQGPVAAIRAAAGIAAGGAVWLTFFPPAGYRRRVERIAAAPPD
ncbi:MAG: hypothetical protein ACQGVK_17130 [Myxococcota bacterium]